MKTSRGIVPKFKKKCHIYHFKGVTIGWFSYHFTDILKPFPGNFRTINFVPKVPEFLVQCKTTYITIWFRFTACKAHGFKNFIIVLKAPFSLSDLFCEELFCFLFILNLIEQPPEDFYCWLLYIMEHFYRTQTLPKNPDI